MRKQNKAIIWPAYFDLNKTRKEGRRVTKTLAVYSPKMIEIQEVATKLGLKNEAIFDKGYPKTPWVKPGMLLVENKRSKEQVINEIAKELQKTRNEEQRQK